EHLEQFLVADLLRVEHDQDDLGVIRRTAAHLAIRRVLRRAGRVADGRRVDARLLPELLLSAPEAAHAEHGKLEPIGKWRLDAMVIHEMFVHYFCSSGSKFIAAPFMQYRRPVGCGPSGNT